MPQDLYTLSNNDKIAIELVSRHKQYSVKDYLDVIENKIGVLLWLVDLLHKENLIRNKREKWVEPLLYKFCFHLSSFTNISKGILLPIESEGRRLMVFDESSAITILRTIIENYLTFYYLYSNDCSEEEKQFRLDVWSYSGIKQRSTFSINSAEGKACQEKDILFADEVFGKIKKSNYFKKYKRIEGEILKGKKPKLDYGWQRLIKESKLRQSFFNDMYSYESSYSHSEFLSILQISSTDNGRVSIRDNNSFVFIADILCSRTICDLIIMFPSLEKFIIEYDEKLWNEIKVINYFISTNNFEDLKWNSNEM